VEKGASQKTKEKKPKGNKVRTKQRRPCRVREVEGELECARNKTLKRWGYWKRKQGQNTRGPKTGERVHTNGGAVGCDDSEVPPVGVEILGGRGPRGQRTNG